LWLPGSPQAMTGHCAAHNPGRDKPCPYGYSQLKIALGRPRKAVAMHHKAVATAREVVATARKFVAMAAKSLVTHRNSLVTCAKSLVAHRENVAMTAKSLVVYHEKLATNCEALVMRRNRLVVIDNTLATARNKPVKSRLIIGLRYNAKGIAHASPVGTKERYAGRSRLRVSPFYTLRLAILCLAPRRSIATQPRRERRSPLGSDAAP
jgi:hypothetical protein